MEAAELFEDGDGQVILLPAGYQLPGDKVYIKRHGDVIMIYPEGSKELAEVQDEPGVYPGAG